MTGPIFLKHPSNIGADLTPVPTATAAVSPANRSRVTNGSQLFVGRIDGRSALARRIRDLQTDLRSNFANEPTPTQEAIIRRAASLCVWCESVEAKMTDGSEIDIAAFTTACNSLRRLLIDIGLENRMKDVTSSVHEYVARKRREAGAP